MIISFIEWDWSDNYSVFASTEYLGAMSDVYGWIGGFKDEKLEFVLPYIINSKLSIKNIYFTSDIICVDGDDNSDAFYEKLLTFLKSSNISFISQQPPQAVSKSYPIDSINVSFGTYLIDLTLSEDDLWNNLHSKHRNVIRNSIKKDIEIVIDSKNLDDLYCLMKETMDRSNMWFFTRPEFNLYMEKMEGKQMSFIAYYKGVAQGCAIMPFSTHAAYYSYGGSVERPFTGAINHMHWNAIKFFKSKGVRAYDFVGARINPKKGSKLEGIQRFKSRFGGELVLGYLWKYPLQKFNYRLFRFLLMCKKRDFKNFSQDIIDQELKR